MKLHGNARTCPRSRCLAVGRVEQGGLDACSGCRGGWCECAYALEVVASFSRGGQAGAARSQLGA